MLPFSVLFIRFAYSSENRIFVKFYCAFRENRCSEVMLYLRV